jgi:hypothetical protein
MAGTRTAAAVWPGVSTAVAALTVARTGSYEDVAGVLGDPVPLEVAEALTAISTALLKVAGPGAVGDQFLKQLGLVALAQTAEDAELDGPG